MSSDRMSEAVDLDAMAGFLDGTEVVYAVCFGSVARGEDHAGSDVDVTVRFPDGLDERERFRHRNRIDAELQAYADSPVDVSDLETLPPAVALRALREGVLVTGDESRLDEDLDRLEPTAAETAEDRLSEQRSFIDRLARGG